MATVQRKLVHKQFNSPIGMYSDDNVKETLDRELKALSNGAIGNSKMEGDNKIDFNEPRRPSNLANSAVLKMLEEQENERLGGYKKVLWPPTDGTYVKGSTPQPVGQPSSQQSQQGVGQQYQPQTAQPNYSQHQPPSQAPQNQYQQQHQHYYQEQHYKQQQEQSNSYSQQQQQQPSRSYNPPHQPFPKGASPSTVSFSGGIPKSPSAQAHPEHRQYQPPQEYQQPQQQYQSPHQYQEPHQQYQQPQQYQLPQQLYRQPQQQYQQPQQPKQQYQPPQQQYQPPQRQYQPQSPSTINLSPLYQPSQQSAPSYAPAQRAPASPKGWHHVGGASPTPAGYTQRYQPSSSAPTSFGIERDLGPHQQLYQSQATHAYQPPVRQDQTSSHQPQQYYQQHHQQYTKFQNYSQESSHQPQYGQQGHGQVPNQYQLDRGQSPGVITLRKEAPINQKPAPVFTSQPAAASFQGGANMRGDFKWPPAEYKAQAEAENEARRRLAMEPAVRPRRVNKDYSQFFAKHALNSTYPGYKAPPGTQHAYVQY